jgi:hypothetical protein
MMLHWGENLTQKHQVQNGRDDHFKLDKQVLHCANSEFILLALPIVFRFIIEYCSLRDFGP